MHLMNVRAYFHTLASSETEGLLSFALFRENQSSNVEKCPEQVKENDRVTSFPFLNFSLLSC